MILFFFYFFKAHMVELVDASGLSLEETSRAGSNPAMRIHSNIYGSFSFDRFLKV